MKCNYCGTVTDVDFTFCPNCGKKAEETPVAEPVVNEPTPVEPVIEPTPVAPPVVGVNSTTNQTPQSGEIPFSGSYTNPAPEPKYIPADLERFMAFGKDSCFLVICILYSVNVGLSLLKAQFPLINILITIFLWLAFVQFNSNTLDPSKIRCISGAVFARKVINYVVAGLLVLAGVLSGVALTALSTSPYYYQALNEISKYAGSYFTIISGLLSFGGTLILVICVITAAIELVLTLTGVNAIHKFIQSSYKSIEAGGLNIVKRKSAQTWFMVFAVFKGLGAASNLFSGNALGFIAGGSISAAFVIMYTMIKKYFGDINS